MENLANLYVINNYSDLENKDNLKIVKITTSQEEVEQFLLTKPKDKHWQVQVYKYISSSQTYEMSKEETFKFKNTIGLCNSCGIYFKRINNSNMCLRCNNEFSKGFKKCEVCNSFYDPSWNEINIKSNSIVLPILCNNCSLKLYELI